MNKVVCYPRSCKPTVFDEDTWYFEIGSVAHDGLPNIGHVGAQLFRELQKSKITPSVSALDFALFALSVVSADKAILRKDSPDGWTREIELSLYINEITKWNVEKTRIEKMLRFLTGDFWKLEFKEMKNVINLGQAFELRCNDCICLLSGGMDSLVGAIDLHEEGRNPLFLSQTVRGDAEHQREYASQLGKNNLCQWSCNVKKHGKSENSTRARSIVFFAFALLASCGIKASNNGRKEIVVPENGFISLNIPMDDMRIGSLSTKTTHPVYMRMLQDIWNDLGINVNLVLPYRFKTKGEVLLECKNQELMKSLIYGTTSCGKYQRHGLRHCGVCVPCLVRRASFIRAGMSDETERGYCSLSLKESNSRDVAAAAIACLRVERDGIEKYVKSSLLFASPEERNEYLGVINRGLEEIRVLLKEHYVL